MMEKVDLVLVGAEGVVESGGIINKVSNTSSEYVKYMKYHIFELRRKI